MLTVTHYLAMLSRSYDTGEDKREKDAFIQQKSFNLIQSQYKVPPRPPP